MVPTLQSEFRPAVLRLNCGIRKTQDVGNPDHLLQGIKCLELFVFYPKSVRIRLRKSQIAAILKQHEVGLRINDHCTIRKCRDSNFGSVR